MTTTYIAENTPGVFGVEVKINKKLEEIASILKKYIEEEDKFKNNGYKRSVKLCVDINEGKVFKTYSAEAVNKETGDITASDLQKTLIEVKKDIKILKNVSFSKKQKLEISGFFLFPISSLPSVYQKLC